jgi:deferrochelatase/peroxidase EfeB
VTARADHSPIDNHDLQGMVRFGHGKLERTCFHALRIRDVAAARAWLRDAAVTNAETTNPPPSFALQVALTSQGLKALGVPDRILSGFSAEFRAGMAGDENRSRRLGDVGSNSPAGWRWGAGAAVPDLLVMIFATPETWPAAEAIAREQRWTSAFETIAPLVGNLDGREPFGFADGLSQPEIDWSQTREVGCEEPAFTNVSALGEFVLGYRNEYGEFTDRPVIDVAPGVDLPAALDAPGRLDLGRHGTYLVLREMHQDVRGFWQYVHAQGGNAREARRLAEAMVGRAIDGTPLVRHEVGDEPNRFTFAGDEEGLQCPLGAHIRRANPRSGDFAGPAQGALSRLVHRLGFGACGWRDDRIASTRFHRILRRGRRFGPPLTPEDALQPAPSGEAARGLYFMCLNANISRQFEFVQHAWLMSAAFDGLTHESDPLLGRRDDDGRGERSDTFSMPGASGAPKRLYNIPDFVSVRGGAYFFLPGIRALRYLASVGT